MSDDHFRAVAFCERFGLRAPVLLAPMAGVPAPALSIAVANAGGMGACGALLMAPEDIRQWAATVRASTNGPFQLNLWIPGRLAARDATRESAVREFLAGWGPTVPASAADVSLPDFDAQCEALLAVAPRVISSVMGVYPESFVARMKASGIAWFAGVTTVAEARAAEAAGADVIVAQGAEAGGHRATFDPDAAERTLVGLFSLLPAVVDAVTVPVVAAGGVADARGVAAALALGASAVQVGSAFLRAPEAGIHPVWANALGRVAPEDTIVTRAFTGRAARAVATEYIRAAMASDAPQPAPYPVQRSLTAAMRQSGAKEADLQRMQAWGGQSAALGQSEPAADIVRRLARAVESDCLDALLKRLIAHLAWADAEAAAAVARMEPGEKRGHAEAIYAHLASAHHTWLARLVGRDAEHPLWPALALVDARALAEASTAEFAERVAEPGWIDRSVTYRNTSGAQFTNRVSDVLAHVALHGSCHRGQLALLARQEASTPAVTEYVAFLRRKVT